MMSDICSQRQALVVVTTYIVVRWRSVDGPGIGHEVQRKHLRIPPSPCPNHVPFRSTHNTSHPHLIPQTPGESYTRISGLKLFNLPLGLSRSNHPQHSLPWVLNRQDPFYSHKQMLKKCQLIACGWLCTSLHVQSMPFSSNSTIKLPYFIVYALHRTSSIPQWPSLPLPSSSGSRLIFQSLRNLLGIACLYWLSSSPPRSSAMTLTPTNHGPGCSSFRRSTRWKERYVSTSSRNSMSGPSHSGSLKIWSARTLLVLVLPYIHPAIDEEVDATTHCQSLHSRQIWICHCRTGSGIFCHPNQYSPLPKTPPWYIWHPWYSITIIFPDIPSIIGISVHPTWNQGLHCQDHVSIVITLTKVDAITIVHLKVRSSLPLVVHLEQSFWRWYLIRMRTPTSLHSNSSTNACPVNAL